MDFDKWDTILGRASIGVGAHKFEYFTYKQMVNMSYHEVKYWLRNGNEVAQLQCKLWILAKEYIHPRRNKFVVYEHDYICMLENRLEKLMEWY